MASGGCEGHSELVRELRTASVGPGGQPERPYVGGGGGELVDQGGGDLVVEAVEVFVVVGFGVEARVAIGEEDYFDFGMGSEAGLEGVVGGIGDERRVVWTHGEEGREAIN